MMCQQLFLYFIWHIILMAVGFYRSGTPARWMKKYTGRDMVVTHWWEGLGDERCLSNFLYFTHTLKNTPVLLCGLRLWWVLVRVWLQRHRYKGQLSYVPFSELLRNGAAAPVCSSLRVYVCVHACMCIQEKLKTWGNCGRPNLTMQPFTAAFQGAT